MRVFTFSSYSIIINYKERVFFNESYLLTTLYFGDCPICNIDEKVNESSYRYLNVQCNLSDIVDLTSE